MVAAQDQSISLTNAWALIIRSLTNDICREDSLKVTINYDRLAFDEGFRIDLLVENLVICELKAVKEVHPVFQAQLLSYMKLTDKRLGYLINFHVPVIKDGIQRFIL